MQIKVKSRFVKTAPRKIRLVINLIKNLSVETAVERIIHLNKAASQPVLELIKSGRSAAKDMEMDLSDLKISKIYCDEGPALKRRKIRSRGRASSFSKKTSHLSLILTDQKIAKTNKSHQSNK